MRRKNILVSYIVCAALSVSMLAGCAKQESGAGNNISPTVTVTPSGDNGNNVNDGNDNNNDNNDNELTGPVLTHPEGFNPSPVTIEAENSGLKGGTRVGSDGQGYSGSGYVEGFEAEGDAVEFTADIKQTGTYDLIFKTMAIGGSKTNFVKVDGSVAGEVTATDTDNYENCICKRVYLEAGSHKVEFLKSWGWVKLDCLIITASEALGEDFFMTDTTLSNKNATANTKKLFEYLTSIYGKRILSGQNADSMYASEFNAIRLATGGIKDGKMPAVLGLDMMDYSPSRIENGSQGKSVESAIEFYKKGGIVTFCWHWNAPSKYLTGQWYSGFYKEYTNINLAKIMNGEDQEGYELLIKDIDAIAVQLKRLQDEGVPILWRPLHEASGGWFWWGASGAEAYKKLYVLLYDRLTNVHGLNNLIWMWNGQAADWYPGDEYVDIVSTDIYPGERVYTSQMNAFIETRNSAKGKKMVYLSENGCLFDPELAVRDGAMWGMWCTWGGEFVIAAKNTNKLSEKYTEKYMLQKVYESDYVITLDELPKIYE